MATTPKPPKNWREFMKLEDQMATLPPMEALGACTAIATMICHSLGITEEQFVSVVRTTFRENPAEIRKGEHWLVQSRRVDSSERH